MRVEYVALILEEKGKFLVERRKKSKRVHAGDIVFPAGRVEPSETKEEALVREMKEELGIDIIGPQLVYQDDSDHQEKQRIYWFKCKSYSGEIRKNEAEELIWINDSKKLTYDISREALRASRNS